MIKTSSEPCPFPQLHESALAMFTAQGGIVGRVGTSIDLLTALDTPEETTS